METGNIHLEYSRQGDDLDDVMVEKNDKCCAKESIKKHMELLQNAINILKNIHEIIPDENDVELIGCGNSFKIKGNAKIIKKLKKKNLVDDISDSEDSYYSDDSEDESSDD